MTGRSDPHASRVESQAKDLPYLLAILSVACVVRVLFISSESVWLDEGFSAKVAGGTVSRILSTRDNTPPLYHLILHVFIVVLGKTELTIRLPSLIFGIATIYMSYRLARTLYDGKTGLIAAVIAACSLLNILYSIEARTYSLTILLSVVSFYFVSLYLRSGTWKDLILYASATALLFYSHVYSMFVILAQNLFFLSLHVRSPRHAVTGGSVARWVMGQGLILALSVPWLSTLGQRVREVSTGFHIERPTLLIVGKTFYKYSGSTILLLFYLLLLSAWLVRRITAGKERGSLMRRVSVLYRRDTLVLILLWLFVPNLTPFLISQAFTPIYSYPYATIALAPMQITIARLVRSFVGWKRAGTVGAIVLLSAFSWGEFIEGYTDNPVYASMPEQVKRLSRFVVNTYRPKEQWRELAAALQRRMGTEDILITEAWYCRFPLEFYYDQAERIHYYLNDSQFGGVLAKAEGRIWLVLSHKDPLKESTIREHLAKSGYVAGEPLRESFARIEVARFEKSPDALPSIGP